MRKAVVSVVGSAVLSAAAVVMSLSPAGAEPTCSGAFGSGDEIANHGQHVVGDYVTGTGHNELGWPPNGHEVGSAVAGSGAAKPGGPGAGGHFVPGGKPDGVAPGASFCLEQSQSPGWPHPAHPGRE